MKKLKQLATKKSWSVNYGHLQFIGGGLALAASFITPLSFPNLSVTTLSSIAMAGGLITYFLRLKTRVALEDK